MQNKTINELTSLENPRLTDTLPIWDGTEGKTKKVSLAKIPANVITPVDSLPESPNILDRVYRYNNKYYVGNESSQTLTELALKADIPTVVDAIENGNLQPVTSNAVYDALNDTPIEITPTLENGFASATFNKVYVFNKSKKLVLKIGCTKDSGDLVNERVCSFPAPSWLNIKSWGYYIPVAIRNASSGNITTAVLVLDIADGNCILSIYGLLSGYQEIRAFGSIIQSI